MFVMIVPVQNYGNTITGRRYSWLRIIYYI